MYVIYTVENNLNKFQDMVRARGKDSEVFKIEEIENEGLLNFIGDKYRDIDAVVYLEIGEEQLVHLAKKVNEIDQDIYQLAVLGRIKEEQKLESYLDELVEKKDWIEIHLFKKLEEHFSQRKSRKLREVISSTSGEISIFTHDNPDLDAIASAMAFEEICEYEGVEAKTYFSGSFGHPETEIFMENTEFIIGKIDEDSIEDRLESASKIVFVDFAEASISDTIPDEVQPDIIIDHHQTNKGVKAKEFTEIRSDIGAASTLMTKHLLNLDIVIPSILGSALLVGIKVDTNNYTKNISSSDYKAISYLTKVADKDILDVLENTPIYSDTVTAMGRAISNRKFKDSVLTTFTGNVCHKDDIAQISNFLLRERDILTVLVYGIKDDKVLMSARSKDLDLNVGNIMEDAYSDIGEAGGHPHAAGGEIPLSEFDDVDKVVEKIQKRFHDEVFEK